MDIKKHIQIYSVQHTGSRFIKSILLNHGWDFVDVKHYQKPYFTNGLCISPIRRPEDVYITWQSRGRIEDFYQAWFNFNETYLNNPDIWLVPVDTSNRDTYLRALSTRLECDLKTDWKPVGCGPRKHVESINLSEIYNLPIVRKFYAFND